MEKAQATERSKNKLQCEGDCNVAGSSQNVTGDQEVIFVFNWILEALFVVWCLFWNFVQIAFGAHEIL